MTEYSLILDEKKSYYETVTEAHFGLNLVTIYDEEFVFEADTIRQNVLDLGASTLRFPGGAATELYFDMADPNANRSKYDAAETLTPMKSFFQSAAEVGVNTTIVLPTRLAFGVAAGEAMIDGSYGSRHNISHSYLSELKQFVQMAINYSKQFGVQITTYEIGNEFWGSGQMTASEYGLVAARVSLLVDDILKAQSYDGVQLAVQSTSAASKIFSSKNDSLVYVKNASGKEMFLLANEAEEQFTAEELSNWTLVKVAGQGSAAAQITQIAEKINSISGAADAIDAVVQHSYETGGFDEVDTSKQFKYRQFRAFEENLNRRDDAIKLEFHMTEWNTRSYGAENNRGLQNASMLIEQVYEMVTNGIDAAQIWPLSFDNAQGLSLVDQDGEDLSIVGEMFAMMSQSLVGLSPILDWSMPEKIDIHGFSSDQRLVLFVSERSGAKTEEVSLNLSSFLDSGYYYVTLTQLWDGGAGGDNARAEPVLSASGYTLSQADEFSFDLDAWANLRIEFVLDQYNQELPMQSDLAYIDSMAPYPEELEAVTVLYCSEDNLLL